MTGQKDCLIEALLRFVRHTKQRNDWPCPECGRRDPQQHLWTIEQTLESTGQKRTVGCWYCSIRPVILEAEKALKRNGVEL